MGLSESFGKIININFPLLFQKCYLETKTTSLRIYGVETRFISRWRHGKLDQDYKAKPCLRVQTSDERSSVIQSIFEYEGKPLHNSWLFTAGQIEKRKQIIVITMLSSGTLTNSIRFSAYLTTKFLFVKLSTIYNVRIFYYLLL